MNCVPRVYQREQWVRIETGTSTSALATTLSRLVQTPTCIDSTQITHPSIADGLTLA